jgi:hypothetical protein
LHHTGTRGVYVCMGDVATTAFLLTIMFAAQGSTSLPWIFPVDFREQLSMSLVVSGLSRIHLRSEFRVWNTPNLAATSLVFG